MGKEVFWSKPDEPEGQIYPDHCQEKELQQSVHLQGVCVMCSFHDACIQA